VIDARQVDTGEGAAEALDPPAVAVGAHRRPVVDRVAPQLTGLRERVGRHAGDDGVLEELRVGAMVGAVVGDVDRHVAEDPHAALCRMSAERLPLALEAHLVGE